MANKVINFELIKNNIHNAIYVPERNRVVIYICITQLIKVQVFIKIYSMPNVTPPVGNTGSKSTLPLSMNITQWGNKSNDADSNIGIILHGDR